MGGRCSQISILSPKQNRRQLNFWLPAPTIHVMADTHWQRLRLGILILRCQSGDVAAFGRLAELYDAPARYFIRRLLGTSQEVDDVVQELWLAVARELPRLRDPASFPSWFYRIARNKVIDRVRKNRNSLEACSEDLEELAACVAEEESFSPEDAAAIHAGLDRLSLPHREVLVLRFLEDMPYEEIAQVLGCRVGTVRSRLFHAKKSLRRVMEPEQ